MYIQLKKVRKV